MPEIDLEPGDYRVREKGRWVRAFDKRFWTIATVFYGVILAFAVLSPRVLPETRMAVLAGGLLTAPFVVSATVLLWNLLHKR